MQRDSCQGTTLVVAMAFSSAENHLLTLIGILFRLLSNTHVSLVNASTATVYPLLFLQLLKVTTYLLLAIEDD